MNLCKIYCVDHCSFIKYITNKPFFYKCFWFFVWVLILHGWVYKEKKKVVARQWVRHKVDEVTGGGGKGGLFTDKYSRKLYARQTYTQTGRQLDSWLSVCLVGIQMVNEGFFWRFREPIYAWMNFLPFFFLNYLLQNYKIYRGQEASTS